MPSIQIQAFAFLLACAVSALLGFTVTWAFFETAGAWRWPM